METNFKNRKKIRDNEFINQEFEGNLELPNCKKIGKQAFLNCKFTGILELPNCEEIGDYAFYNSKFQGTLYAPKLKKIGKGAFLNSTMLKNLYLPSLKEAGENAFELFISVDNVITIGQKAKLGKNWISKNDKINNAFLNEYNNTGKKGGVYKYMWRMENWKYQKK